MPNIAELVARLTLNAKDFTAKFDGAVNDATTRARAGGAQIGRAFSETAGGGLRDFAGQVPLVGGALTSLSGVALGAAAGVGALAAGVGFALSNTEEYAQASRGLEAVLKATGNQTGLTTDELKVFAEQQESALAISAESILGAEKALASFDGVAGSTFKRAILSAADLAAVYGGDLAGNAEKLGVVLQNLAEGNVEGLAKGFKFLGTATLDTIAALAKAGDTAGAQTALLDALEQKVGGAGGAAGQGIAGAFFRLSDAIGDTSRAFAEQSGLYGAVVSGLNSAAEAVGNYADKLQNLSKTQLAIEALKATSPLYQFGRATGLISDPTANRGRADEILAQEARRQKTDENERARLAASAAKRKGDEARAAADAAEASKKAAAEQAKQAVAAEAAAKAVERQKAALSASIADLEFQAQLAGVSREEAEKLTAIRSRELQFGKLFTAEQKKQVLQAIDLKNAAVATETARQAAGKAALDAGQEYFDQLKRQQDEDQRAIDQQKAEALAGRRQDFQILSDSFYDLFSGRAGNIWTRFKEIGKNALADLAANFVLGSSFNISGGGGGIVGGIVNKVGGAISSSLLGGLGGGLAGGIAGSLGLSSLIGGTGLAASAGITASTAAAAGIPGLAGAGAFGASGGTGLLGAAAAAAPYLAAIAGVVALGAAIIPGVTERAFAGLGVDSNGQAVNTGSRARGKNQVANSATANAAADSFAQALNALADTLGAKLTPGVQLGELGLYKGKYSFNLGQGDGGQLLQFDKADEAVAAALSEAVKRGALTGLSDATKTLLGKGDLNTQVVKAVQLENALKELNGQNDPTVAAVKSLNDEFTKLRDIMAEAGSSAADVAKASALYDEKLKAIRDSAGGATTTLKAFLDDLGFGSGSPLALGDQAAAARANYAASAALIGTKSFDQGAFVAAGQRLLDIEGQISGRTQDFFSVFNQVQADTNRAITGINNAVTIAGDNPFVRKTADNTGATADNTAGILAGVANLPADIAAAIAAALAAGGFGGQFIGGNTRGFVAA